MLAVRVQRYRKNPLDISITEKILQSNGKPLQIVDGSATREGVIYQYFYWLLCSLL